MRVHHDDWMVRGPLRVFLDGVEQKAVQWYDIEAGELSRGYRGDPLTARQTKLKPSGYVFDNDAGDFVLEVVRGVVTVEPLAQ